MAKSRKAQVGEVINYGLIGLFSIIILISGYKMISIVREKACQTEVSKFEIDLKGIDKSLRFGAKELQSYVVPCQVDKIYFFDLSKKINPSDFGDIPLLKDSLESGSSNNVFLIKDGEVKRSFYAGNLDIFYPYNICFVPNFGKISFSAEGTGKSVKIRSACNQPECTSIPVDINEEDSKKIIQEAIYFGCANCPADLDSEAKNIKLTKQNVEIFRRFLYCDGITDVQIIIKTKKGSKAKNFRYYEFIPKGCIEDLNKYLAENIGDDVDIKGDPLILWHFADLGYEKRISYRLSTDLSDDCKQAIKGLGIAGEIPKEKINTPPTIANLLDVTVYGTGLKNGVISNLWEYAYDKETDPKKLVYSIADQTNPDLVECSIGNEKSVDCEVKQNADGVSIVIIQVSDLEFQTRASFNVTVSQFCKKHDSMQCVGNDIFWFDSCSNQGELYKACGLDEVCLGGECKQNCNPNAEKKCDGSGIYWFDSCGKKDQLFYDCKDNLLRTNCKDAECCIGNFLCKEPVSSCKDECIAGGKRCDGSTLQICSDSDNDSCEDWNKSIECGSDYCTDFGGWSCNGLSKRVRYKTCYNKGCSEGNCYSNELKESQEEVCFGNQDCVNGACQLKSGCAYNNPPCGSDYDCILTNNTCQLKKGCQYNNPPCDAGLQCTNNNCVSPPDDNSGGSGGGGTECLLNGTLVLDSNNINRKIEELNNGDIIKSVNLSNNKIIETKVTKVVKNHPREGYFVINYELYITNDHPIYVMSNNTFKWIKVENLKIGYELVSPFGLAKINSIVEIKKPTSTVYVETDSGNFIVKGKNDYYIVKSNYGSIP